MAKRQPKRGSAALQVVSDGRGLAERLLACAKRAGLRCAAPRLLQNPAECVAALDELPRGVAVVVALHGAIDSSLLRALSSRSERPTLLVIAEAARVPAPAALWPVEHLDSVSVAQALGLPACSVPAHALDICRLRRDGLTARGAAEVIAATMHADTAPLATHALREAGLRLGRAPRALSDAASARVGDVLVAGADGSLPRALDAAYRDGPDGAPATLVVDAALDEALGVDTPRVRLDAVPSEPTRAAAIAAVLRAAPPERRTRRRASRRRCVADSNALLDGCRQTLGELEVKALLGVYGVAAPREVAVRSASAAGDAAALLGFPLTVRAIGPEIDGRSAPAVSAVSTVAAGRQAFRDVVLAHRRESAQRVIDSVLVSRQQQWGPFISMAAVLEDDAAAGGAAALLHASVTRRPGTAARPLACSPIALPDADAELALAREIAELLELDRGGSKALLASVRRVTDLAADHAKRLRWIALDQIDVRVLEDGTTRLELVTGRCEQRESLRDPLRALGR